MKKRLAFVLIVMSISGLVACGSKNIQTIISKELGIDVSDGNKVTCSDRHRGFHGDGVAYITLSFSDEKTLERIKDAAEWKRFPLDETVKALVYGVSDRDSTMGPFLTDEEGNALIPEIQNGYYLLIDRQAEPGKAERADILRRSSFNFTLGIYDTDTDMLYFCKLDT